MYKANMHITPAKVRARVCELLEKDHEELVHLSNGSILEGDNNLFVLISYDTTGNPFEKYSYSVCEYDSEKDELTYRSVDLTYSYALHTMSEIIEE